MIQLKTLVLAVRAAGTIKLELEQIEPDDDCVHDPEGGEDTDELPHPPEVPVEGRDGGGERGRGREGGGKEERETERIVREVCKRESRTLFMRHALAYHEPRVHSNIRLTTSTSDPPIYSSHHM